MKTTMLFLAVFIGFPAGAVGNAIVSNDEVVTVRVQEKEGERTYRIPHHDLGPEFASSNYYCKKTESDKWIRCSRRTGQCFGEAFDQKFQCQRALP